MSLRRSATTIATAGVLAVGLFVPRSGAGSTRATSDPHRRDSSRLLPASTMKLFTSATAMATLGPDFRFHTDVLANSSVTRGVLHGSLY